MMERRSVVISTLIVLSAGLIAVPSIGLLHKGCHAGTRGLLEWLPESWDGPFISDRSCEAGDLLSKGYKVLCPARKHGAIQQLLDSIGFFGSSTEAAEELAICQYGKSAWSWFTNGIDRIRDATLDLHHSVTKALGDKSISWEGLVGLFLENVTDGGSTLWNLSRETGANVAQQFLKIPQQFNYQYSKLWEFYHNVRASQDQWTSGYSNNTIVSEVTNISGAVKKGNWKYVKRGYLLPFWRYITCDVAKLKTKQPIFNMEPVESKPSVHSGGVDQRLIPTDVTEIPSKPYQDGWQTVTREYVTKLMKFVTNSAETNERPEEVETRVEESIEGHVKEENITLIAKAEVVVITEEAKLPEQNTIEEEDILVVDDAYTRALKKVLFESLIATVLAFTLFILGVFFHRVLRTRLFGFQWPSLVQVVVSRYKPVRLIKTAENFNTFHMVCKRTRQNVAVKCLQAASTSSARTDFSTELHSLKRLRHPNVVSLLDCIRAGPSFCLGLEYAPYGNLKDAARNQTKAFGFEQKVAVYRQVLEAINWMHKSGWAHLNIRPGTILIFDKWSQVKLSGFTAAVECFKKELCCNYDLHPMCSSPRVITRQPYDPKKADLWALGCLLYFIFTQREVHSPEGALRLARVVCRMDYERRSSYGLNLIKLLADLLSFHPENRPELSFLIDTINNLA